MCFQSIVCFFLSFFLSFFVHIHLSNFFSYPVAVTITGDRAANLDLCLALMAFGSEGSFRATTFAIRDFGLYGLIRRTGTHVQQWDLNRGCKDHQILALPL
jgi:hypothetical protein